MSLHSRFRHKLFRHRSRRELSYKEFWSEEIDGPRKKKERQFWVSTLSMHRSYVLNTASNYLTKVQVTNSLRTKRRSMRTHLKDVKQWFENNSKGKWADGTSQRRDDEEE